MGITIWHKGGKVPEKTVDHILTQLQDRYKREGYRDGTGFPSCREKCFFKIDEPIEPREKEHLERTKVSKERANVEHFVRELQYERPDQAEFLKNRFEEELRRDVMLPDDFNATHVKGICLNLPHTETFCVEFVKDDGKDEWRSPEDITKTQYARQSGIHVELCEYLTDVERKMKNAGSDLKITDEGEYCDDKEPRGSVQRLEGRLEDGRQIIEKVGGMLAAAGWQTDQFVPKQEPTSGGGPPGKRPSLEDWMAARRADIVLSPFPQSTVKLTPIKQE